MKFILSKKYIIGLTTFFLLVFPFLMPSRVQAIQCGLSGSQWYCDASQYGTNGCNVDGPISATGCTGAGTVVNGDGTCSDYLLGCTLTGFGHTAGAISCGSTPGA